MKICAIVPSYRHIDQVEGIVERLCAAGLAVFIVDDGNDDPIGKKLAKLANAARGVNVLRLKTNQGKGGAVIAGMQAALVDGYTHALQVDADGQHDLTTLPQFLDAASRHPEAVICGTPLYDDTIPLGRKIGRWITHIWVWIETLSTRIADSMCGFRVYPLDACAPIIARDTLGQRMDFDIEILVRLFWAGTAPVPVPVKVIYPPGNPSNFDVLKDNWRISKMHGRLFFAMLAHLPSILARRPPRRAEKRNWANLSERGAYLGIKFCAIACRLLGRGGRTALMAPIVLYFYLTGTVQRRACRAYLTRVLGRKPQAWENFAPFLNFALRALDVLLAWTGRLPKSALELTDGNAIRTMMEDGRGGMLVVSHLGNVDAVRALVDAKTRNRFTVLVHTRHAVNYNRVLTEGAAEAADNLFQVTEIGPETIIALKERVDAGGWVVIAGDRTPVAEGGRTVTVPFLGAPARFPEGPWILAELIGAPVYLMFSLRQHGRYRVSLEKFADRVVLPRGNRRQGLEDCAARFAARLEHYCALAPLQWYNFYDFWEAK